MADKNNPTPSAARAAYQRFKDLDFEGFRELARDGSLSRYEKIGFPNEYRQGREADILADILGKLPSLLQDETTLIDIGCGCSDLPMLLQLQGEAKRQHLVMVDSQEMLDQLPASPSAERMAGYFPQMPELTEKYEGKADAVLVYSVLQYVFAEGNVFAFMDAAVKLLAPGGRLLVGDIPNSSMRRRFLLSEAGIRHHREYAGNDSLPEVAPAQIEPKQIDDGVLTGLLLRYRAAGYHSFVLPQAPSLPMANRREDLLIVRP